MFSRHISYCFIVSQQVVFIDAKFGGANKLNWPFFAIGGINEEGNVRMFAHAFATSETHDAYRYVIFIYIYIVYVAIPSIKYVTISFYA